ncbi:flagellar hook protein FlgE [Thauera sp. Sel9]|uniref:flagellar hook protein FlgE n=1 Tax=Thauera sp. Sel9 TaxID=2974299 RepID=UPI0021E17495|nr:flagellar hook protein FlgE [Thauera sp. Sel9]MCV2216767.1 flagellar hook protein FlgE [Thauera sp. Sel9]
MAFQQGLSGLSSSSKALDVISNNVANASTVGFKNSGTVFADAYASSLTGAVSKIQIGIGSAVQAVRQAFTQGNVTTTSNPLDMAINGNGFFEIELQNGGYALTRNGQFDINKQGYIITALGDRLMGYQTVDPVSGDVAAPATSSVDSFRPLIVPASGIGAVQTTEMSLNLNLSADAETIDGAAMPLDPSDPLTYTYSTGIKIFDTLGKEHTLSFYFARRTDVVDTTTTPPSYSEWDVYTVVDNDPGSLTHNSTLGFDGLGRIAEVTPHATAAVTPPANGSVFSALLGTDAVNPSEATLAMNSITQFGGESKPRELLQNGAAPGEIAGLAISRNGVIQARYTNGVSKDIGIVNLTTVRNNNGLSPIGNNYWVETPESGGFARGTPGNGMNGVISAGQVEESNVDLTQELVQMIIQQRNYQANAQSIRTQDQILQTLVNLR